MFFKFVSINFNFLCHINIAQMKLRLKLDLHKRKKSRQLQASLDHKKYNALSTNRGIQKMILNKLSVVGKKAKSRCPQSVGCSSQVKRNSSRLHSRCEKVDRLCSFCVSISNRKGQKEMFTKSHNWRPHYKRRDTTGHYFGDLCLYPKSCHSHQHQEQAHYAVTHQRKLWSLKERIMMPETDSIVLQLLEKQFSARVLLRLRSLSWTRQELLSTIW